LGYLFHLFQAANLAAGLHLLTVLLHELVGLHVRLEELRRAAVEADGFALVDLAFAVVGGDALSGADLGEAGLIEVSISGVPATSLFSSTLSLVVKGVIGRVGERENGGLGLSFPR